MDTMPQVQLITPALIEGLVEQARQSPRRRINHNFHSGPDDNPHRFLNVLLEQTYVRPHRHLDPPKSESFLVLQGEVALWIFDGDGSVTQTHRLGPSNSIGIDIPPGVWHTLTATSPVAVCYEVKPGPWDPARDKEFSLWSPEEASPQAQNYLRSLLTLVLQ